MALTLYDRVKMTTSTTGTGTITLGSTVTGFRSFAGAGVPDGASVSYAIEDGSAWEIGVGKYTSTGTTITRSVLASSNSNNPITLTGAAYIYITGLSTDLAYEDTELAIFDDLGLRQSSSPTDINNAYWPKNYLTVDSTTYPDHLGGTGAVSLLETVANQSHQIGEKFFTKPANIAMRYRYIAILKGIGRDSVQMFAFNSDYSSGVMFSFNFVTGVAANDGSYGSSYSNLSASMQRLANGYWRCVLDFTAGAGSVDSSVSIGIVTEDGTGTPTFVGDVTKGMAVYGIWAFRMPYSNTNVRELLTSSRTYYVRTDGSDSNTGLANSSGGAFLTIQKAINVIADSLDSSSTFTIQVGAGTYAGFLCKRLVGSSASVTITGDTVTPANVIITSSGTAFGPLDNSLIESRDVPNLYTIQGFTLNSTMSANVVGIKADRARVRFGSIDFGTGMHRHQVKAINGAHIEATSDYSISSGATNAQAHVYCEASVVILTPVSGTRTVTVNSSAFNTGVSGFVVCIGGYVSASSMAFTITTATGYNYYASNNGTIVTGSDAYDYFPGGSGGQLFSGGFYNNIGADPEVLTANRTYYAHPTGQNYQDGLASTRPMLLTGVISKVFNRINLNGFNVTIQLADGTYSSFANITIAGPQIGLGTITIQGNTGTPANVIWTQSANTPLTVSGGAQVTVNGIEFRNSTSGFGILVTGNGSQVTLGSAVRFGACSTSISCQNGGMLQAPSGYAVVGNATTHMSVINHGMAIVSGTIAFTTSTAFTTLFSATSSGIIILKGTVTGTTVTGVRFALSSSSFMQVTANASLTYLPGNAAGTYDVSSYYNSTTSPPSGSGQTLLVFRPGQNEPPATNYALYGVRNGHPYLAFDTTTQWAAIFSSILPREYTGGGLTVVTHTMMASATSGTVGYTVDFERMDDSSLDLDADSFGSTSTITAATVPGTSGQTLLQSVNVATGATMDSLVAGEQFRLRIRRDVANDTATGDAQLVLIEIRET